MKPQINDMEHKEVKSNQLEQEEKRIQENEGSISSLWDNFRKSNTYIIARRRRERARNWKSIWKNNENFFNLVAEIDMKVQEAQSPKQDGPKEGHTKTHHN